MFHSVSNAAFTPETCVPDEQHVSGYMLLVRDVAGYKLLVRDTCWLYVGDIITIYLCHGRRVSFCIQQQTGNNLATFLSPIQETCWRQHVWIQVDTTCVRQHVSWCKRGLRFCNRLQMLYTHILLIVSSSPRWKEHANELLILKF